MRFEPEALGRIPFIALWRDKSRIDLEKDVREAGAKVGTVDGGVAGGFRRIHVFAFGAVELDGFLLSKV